MNCTTPSTPPPTTTKITMTTTTIESPITTTLKPGATTKEPGKRTTPKLGTSREENKGIPIWILVVVPGIVLATVVCCLVAVIKLRRRRREENQNKTNTTYKNKAYNGDDSYMDASEGKDDKSALVTSVFDETKSAGNYKDEKGTSTLLSDKAIERNNADMEEKGKENVAESSKENDSIVNKNNVDDEQVSPSGDKSPDVEDGITIAPENRIKQVPEPTDSKINYTESPDNKGEEENHHDDDEDGFVEAKEKESDKGIIREATIIVKPAAVP
ncbi:uncharacterized protein LOC144453274 [Glandiceps talaboti]